MTKNASPKRRAAAPGRPQSGESEPPAPPAAVDPNGEETSPLAEDDARPPLLFADILRALPDERHRTALLEMIMRIGAIRQIFDSRPLRIAMRDEAIREAFAVHYACFGRTRGVEKLADALLLHAKASYPHLAPDACSKRVWLHWILLFSDGKPLSASSIRGLI